MRAMDPLWQSHIVLPGVGAITERRLWSEGVHTLEDFVAAPRLRGISPQRKRDLNVEAQRAVAAHAGRDARYFAQHLPHSEVWRMFARFADEAAYLDIETSGLSRSAAITVVGVYRPAAGFTALVRGRGLSAANLTQALEGAKLLVTFNGASFDLPFIRNQMPSARLPPAHLDLLSVARRLDWRGGLKRIEQRLGLKRDLETRVLAGADAVRLWRAWEKTGSENALRLLTRYNEHDCRNLEEVARAGAQAMVAALAMPPPSRRLQTTLAAA